MRLIVAAWLLMSVGVFAVTRLERGGHQAAARPVAAVTGLLACVVVWRLYRLGWEDDSFAPVPAGTRRNARRLLWALLLVGVGGAVWEIFRAYQRTLG
jgi:hypothetical protein